MESVNDGVLLCEKPLRELKIPDTFFFKSPSGFVADEALEFFFLICPEADSLQQYSTNISSK